MKSLLFICLFIYCSDGAMGQDYNEYATVDEKAFRIPDTITNSTASIAAYIQSNFVTEKEKLRAIYTWVTANIRYDTDSMYYKKWGETAEESRREAS